MRLLCQRSPRSPCCRTTSTATKAPLLAQPFAISTLGSSMSSTLRYSTVHAPRLRGAASAQLCWLKMGGGRCGRVVTVWRSRRCNRGGWDPIVPAQKWTGAARGRRDSELQHGWANQCWTPKVSCGESGLFSYVLLGSLRLYVSCFLLRQEYSSKKTVMSFKYRHLSTLDVGWNATVRGSMTVCPRC